MGLKKLKLYLKYGKITSCNGPAKWEINKDDKILILTPHPDDETIACGGLLSLYASQCDVILLTDGCHGDPNIEPKKMANIRWKEFSSVMTELGVNNYHALNIEDGKLLHNHKIFKNIDVSGYKYILMPHKNDSHIDHVAVFILMNKYFRKYKKNFVFYELWTPMERPTHFIDISDVIDKKYNLINKYKCQTSIIDYAEIIKGLNRYRGLISNIKYSEMYYMYK